MLGVLLGCSRSPEVRPTEAKQAAPAETVFVQLFEWRWADVAKECETYLGPVGFSAVQISPPNEHSILPGHPWWQRYQAVSYGLEKSRSGTLDEFRDMVSRCRQVGVDIYVDAVINHMTAQVSGTGSSGTRHTKYGYPGLYAEQDFHAPPCVIADSDYGGAPDRVRNCELLGLADLNTSEQSVRDKIVDYLAGLVELGVRGFRIDAAKHVAPTDLDAIMRLVGDRTGPAKLPYYFLEVIDYGKEAIHAADYLAVGAGSARGVDITEFKYSAVGDKFLNEQGAMIAELRALEETAWNLLPSDQAVVFTTNHDTERGNAIFYSDGPYLDLATVFLLAWPYGYPAILSSYAFDRGTQNGRDMGPPSDASGNTLAVYPSGGDSPSCATDPVTASGGSWLCQHRRPFVAGMVGFRRATDGARTVTHFWDDAGNQIAFGRGEKGFVVINRSTAPLSRAFETDLPGGQYCDVLTGSGGSGKCSEATIEVDQNGIAPITVPPVSAVAIHVAARRN